MMRTGRGRSRLTPGIGLLVFWAGCTALNSAPRPAGQGGAPSGTGATGFVVGGHGGTAAGGPGGTVGGGGATPETGSGGVVGAAGAPGSGGIVGAAGAPGSGGVVGTAGGPGVGGAVGSGGTVGSGGYTGAGTAIVPDANGHVDGTTNAFGITGSWYGYTDGVGADGMPAHGDCEQAQHAASQCSTLTTPVPDGPFPNTGGKMCAAGTAALAADIIGMTGAPDYMHIWGSSIAMDLAYVGTTRGTFNATAKGVTGLSFDLQLTTAPASGFRVEFNTPSTDGNVDGPAYWGGDKFYSPSPLAAGTNKVYFADVRGPRGVAFDPTKIESIVFHVPTNPNAPTPFSFCVSNLTVLTDNGGGCPPPLAGGTCNIPACGCGAGSVCYPDTPATGLACFPSGNLPEGADCSNATCAAGLGCFGGVCKKYCHSDLDCPLVDSARSCEQTTWSANQMTIPGVSVCRHVCDPVSPQAPRAPLLACPAGLGCFAGTGSPGVSDCQPQTGAGTAGATCLSNDDCAPGNFCDSTGSLCWRFCYTNNDCAVGSTCAAFSTPLYAGTSQVGYCTQ